LASGEPPLLSVRNVRKTYQSARGNYVALSGLNVDIKEGEFLCLLGPSGCGKSTLLNLLAGFEPVTAGSIVCEGRAVTGAGQERVVAFQDANEALFPWLTVEENIRFGLRARRIPRASWSEITDLNLRMVDLDRHRDKFPGELSGGMRQRLQIARALAVNPKILLMDEPFAALDALTRRRMHSFLIDVWQRTGKTIIFVTHDIAEALVIADRVAMMSVGPASSIMKIIDIELPRPRDITSAGFVSRYREIDELLASEMARAEMH
jgi:NitT/TauT family transport system ATP-binding protein